MSCGDLVSIYMDFDVNEYDLYGYDRTFKRTYFTAGTIGILLGPGNYSQEAEVFIDGKAYIVKTFIIRKII